VRHDAVQRVPDDGHVAHSRPRWRRARPAREPALREH
jgi:hypothetical protein